MNYDPKTYWPDRYAAQGETYVARGGRRDSFEEQLRVIGPMLTAHLPTSGRVLDFGCGPGRFRPILEAHGLEYTGVDLIPGLGTCDVADLEPESFDAAVAVFVLQHIVDQGEYETAVRLIGRSVKPGGTLLVIDATAGSGGHMHPRGELAFFLADPATTWVVLGSWTPLPDHTGWVATKAGA